MSISCTAQGALLNAVLVAQSCPTLSDPLDCRSAPRSVGFPRQEYWNRLPFPFPGDFPDPGIEPGSPALQADSLPSDPPDKALAVFKN